MNLIAILFFISCVALILIILVQKGRGGGLSGAFGGSMASGILGSKTGDFLTWVTIILVGIMFTFAVILAMFYKPTIPSNTGAAVSSQTQTQPVPEAIDNESEINAQGNETSTPGAMEPDLTNNIDIDGSTDNSDTNQPTN